MPNNTCIEKVDDDLMTDEDVVMVANQILSEEELALRGGWRTVAKCRGYPAIWWFPVRRASIGLEEPLTPYEQKQLDAAANVKDATPKDVCLNCPVRFECLSESIHEDFQGTWGGTSHIFRRKIAAHLEVASPAILSPDCGTASGWLRHQRFPKTAGPPCDACTDAALSAGLDAHKSALTPLSIAALFDVASEN